MSPALLVATWAALGACVGGMIAAWCDAPVRWIAPLTVCLASNASAVIDPGGETHLAQSDGRGGVRIVDVFDQEEADLETLEVHARGRRVSLASPAMVFLGIVLGALSASWLADRSRRTGGVRPAATGRQGGAAG